jgi:hypothetical protein
MVIGVNHGTDPQVGENLLEHHSFDPAVDDVNPFHPPSRRPPYPRTQLREEKVVLIVHLQYRCGLFQVEPGAALVGGKNHISEET